MHKGFWASGGGAFHVDSYKMSRWSTPLSAAVALDLDHLPPFSCVERNRKCPLCRDSPEVMDSEGLPGRR